MLFNTPQCKKGSPPPPVSSCPLCPEGEKPWPRLLFSLQIKGSMCPFTCKCAFAGQLTEWWAGMQNEHILAGERVGEDKGEGGEMCTHGQKECVQVCFGGGHRRGAMPGSLLRPLSLERNFHPLFPH